MTGIPAPVGPTESPVEQKSSCLPERAWDKRPRPLLIVSVAAGVVLAGIMILAALRVWKPDTAVKEAFEVINSAVVSTAVVLGGLWASYQFIFRRENETRLGIRMTTSSHQYPDGSALVFFDVELTNEGNCKLAAKRGWPAYEDRDERFEFPCALEIKGVGPTDLPPSGPQNVDWFKSGLQSAIGAVNLLFPYQVDDFAEFWMEPTETYHLGTSVVLHSGLYLVKVTFIGAGDREFWTRVFSLAVEPNSSAGRLP